MRPHLIAQRLQIEHLAGRGATYKSCRKTQSQLHKQAVTETATDTYAEWNQRLTGRAKSTPALRLASTVAGTSSRESGISWRESPSRAYRVLAVSA
jgi:hypothetical protein